jgi:two-component system sensor histidine kinase SenX3
MRENLRKRVTDLEQELEAARARADAALSEAARLRHTLDAIPHAVVVCDDSGKAIFRNRLAVNLVTARHSDALAARAVEEVLIAARRGEPQRKTLELRGPPARSLVLTSSALSADGEPIGTIAVIEDVSERRHLEAVRRDFVANVSHELRTPVGALAILAETLGGEKDQDVVKRLARRIGNEAQRVGRIIEDLLDLSRMEADSETARDVVAVGMIVAAAVDRIRPAAERRRLTIQRRGDVDGLKVVGDERQLVSAVGNLLDNAVKYSDASAVVEIGGVRNGDWVEIAVHDEGIGIPSKDLERIFERFYRVDRARSRQTGGTGLGLSIVRHVATNHGGEVLVESCEGEGSTFTLRLPAAETVMS